MSNISLPTNGFGFIGWKHYNKAIKKAMEQEFSWSGLLISLSIAFFIVLASAFILNLLHQSIEATKEHNLFLNNKIYQLENVGFERQADNYINRDYIQMERQSVLNRTLKSIA